MPWTELAIGFGGALVGAVIGALATVYFQRRSDRAKEKEAIRFHVYLRLLDCLNPLFWMSCDDMHERRPIGMTFPSTPHEHLFQEMAWKTADELRKIDDLPQMERILRALFGESFSSAANRHEELGRVIDELAEECNPRFCRVLRALGKEHLRLSANRFKAEMAKEAPKVAEDLQERLGQGAREGFDAV